MGLWESSEQLHHRRHQRPSVAKPSGGPLGNLGRAEKDNYHIMAHVILLNPLKSSTESFLVSCRMDNGRMAYVGNLKETLNDAIEPANP